MRPAGSRAPWGPGEPPPARGAGSLKALVTGGDGFVGRHLISHLLSSGDTVAATTLAPEPDLGTLDEAEAAAVRWSRVDVLEEGLAARIAALRPNRIFHLAGFSSGARARERPGEALRVNAVGTLKLLEAVREARDADPSLDPLILVPGSADAYGRPLDPGVPLREQDPLRPESPYGASKAAQETVALTYSRYARLRVVAARLFPLIGPGQGGAFVLPSLCAQASRIAAGEMEPVLHVGNLHVERDFTDVRDGVEALRRLAEPPATDDVTFNVCSGVARPVRDLVAWVIEEAGIDPEVRVDPARVRPDEPPRIVGSPERIARATGWRPRRDPHDSVRDAYRWHARSLVG